MRYPGFIGGSYPSQSPIADGERTVNLYVEAIDAPNGKNRVALYPTPGFQTFLQVADVGTRALFAVAGRCFAVVGTGFYELFATQLATLRGTVVQDAYPATISYNGTAGGQLFLTSGGNGYCYDMSTHVVTQVLTGDATMGAFLDAYFLAFNITTGHVRLSDLNDGLTWDPTQFFARTIAADPWQTMLADGNRQLWLIGQESGEVWYDSGASPQPFAPIPGAVFPSGTVAPFAVGVANGNVVWVERTKDGAGRIVAARGYVPQAVSTYAVDTQMATYARTSMITDAELLVYQDQGHTFVNCGFPSANATWTLDVDRPSWAERGAWNSNANRYDLWKPRVHCYAFGKHLVGDRSSGLIKTMDVTYSTEWDGAGIRRLRRAPGINDENRRLRYDRFELLMETGLGLASGQGSAPVVMMRASDDGGKIWSTERQAGTGALGQYRTRVYWTRCGTASDRVFEVTCTDPVPLRIIDAFINNTAQEQAA